MWYIKPYKHHIGSVVLQPPSKMEEQLKKLVEHAEPKPSHLIVVSGNKSRLETIFNPPLVFPRSCRYEMALCRLETYYSFPNIDATNNMVKMSKDNGKTWTLISIPIGCYEIKAINNVLQRLIVEVAGGKADIVTLSPNPNTLKCILEIKTDDYKVDFNVDHSLRSVLGFNAKIYKHGRHESENLVDIMNVNSILVHCDIVGAARVNGIEAPVIYNFFPNVAPGEKIVSKPLHLIHLPLMLNVISHMTCWLTDQNGRELDLRGEELTLTFHMKAC